MTDLSTLSDADLTQAYQKFTGNGPAPTPSDFTGPRITVGGSDPSRLSDEQLRSAYEAHQAEVAKGVVKQLGVGVAKGGIGLVGLPGDVRNAASAATDYIGDKLGVDPQTVEAFKGGVKKIAEYSPDPVTRTMATAPTSHDIQGRVENITGPFRKPQNQTEADAETFGEFGAAGLAGPGGLLRKLALQTALPAASTITAGRLSDQNPYVKALAGFLAGAGGAMISSPGSAEKILRAKIPASVTEQDITRAGQLIEHAQQRGVALTWPEALSRVTGQPVLTDMQRVLESHAQTRPHMNDFFADRPAQVDRAALSELDQLAPGTARPSQVGPAVGRAANEEIGDMRKAINAASEPFYKNSENVLLTPHEMASVKQIPGYQEARDAVRNSPQLNSYVAHLPDNSVGFLNEVKKYFDAAAKNAGSKFNPTANQQVGAVNEKAASALKQIGELKSQDYAIALAIQQRAREQYLQPLLDGPLGRLAKKDITTQRAIDALFPSNPLPNSHHEIADAVSRLAVKNPGAATQLVRAHVESMFNEATRALQGGTNQFGGAAFAKALTGNPQQRANLQAAIEALPGGATKWQGFEHLLDVMSATGTRQPRGSLTAFNALEVGSMNTGGLQQLAAKGLSPGKWMNLANDTFQSWSIGRNLDQLARIITDPRAGNAFNQIIRIPPASDRALVLTGRMINQLGATTTDQRNKPAQNEGR